MRARVINRLLSSIGLGVAALSGLAPAHSDEFCGLTIHERYGETRAFSGDALGACRPDGYCSVVLALADPKAQAAYLQQMRIARPTPGAPYQVEFTAVEPMPSADGKPQVLGFGRTIIDLSPILTSAGAVNDFRITEQASADKIVALARKAHHARWTYATDAKPYTATYSLRGVSRALDWMDCMGRLTPPKG